MHGVTTVCLYVQSLSLDPNGHIGPVLSWSVVMSVDETQSRLSPAETREDPMDLHQSENSLPRLIHQV